METVSYLLNWADSSISVVDGIKSAFPCMVAIHDIDEDCYEAIITARIEDLPAIERRLAPYV